MTEPRRRIRIVHGEIASGKTRRVADWVQSQVEAGRSVGGVLAVKTPQGRRFMDILSGEEVALENPVDHEATVPVGRFVFRRAAFDWAVARIEAAVEAQCQALVIDEVGPLELRGDGFADLLDRLAMSHRDIEQVLLVRTGLVEAAIERFARGADVVFDPARDVRTAPL